MGIIAAGQITVVDLSDAPVLNTFITASRPTTQTYSKDSRTYKPSYASTPQVLTLKVTKAGSTANIIDSISSLHWFVVDGPIKTEITSKDNSANEYISGTHNEILTTKLDIDLNKGSKRYEVMGIWPDPSTGLDVQFGGYIDLLLTQNGATGPQGPQGDTGNGIANTVVTYGLSMSDTTEPATWSSERPALVKGMYLWTRTVIIYTNGQSTTSYQISYIAKDADATAEIDKTKQELLEKLETVRDESLEAVDEAKQQLVTVRDESLAAAEEAKQGLANVASELNTAKQDLADSVTAVNNKVDSAKEELTQAKQQLTTVADDLSTAKQDFQNAVSAVDTKATNLKSDLTQAKQDLNSQAQQLQAQANAQSELTKRVSSVEKTANGTKTTVSELSKTVAQNGKDITSVTARTKVVEDDLVGTKTTLSQVKTTADSTSQKTATLETGLNGLSAKFNSLKVGSRNYFKNSKSRKYYIDDRETQDVRTVIDDEFWKNDTRFTKDYVRMSFDIAFNPALPSDFTTNVHFSASPWYNCGGITFKGGTTDLQHFDLKFNLSGAGDSYKTDNVFIRLKNTLPLNTAVSLENFNLYLSAVVEDYTQNEADIESKVAEYKQNADQNYASLQTTVQNLDGTVQHNKTVAEQTAEGFKTRIESLETYKSGESTRANQYFELAKTETARQLTAERTAIAKDYVAKSTYTSDVTGIRNELSATTATANTTKTNLANYQATNDRAVANLQSNIQTANGDISSLKTKVEAVPGQITSAVSAVEGKIPTNVSTRNLILKSNDFRNPHKQGGANTTVSSTDDYFVIKSTGYTANAWGGMSWNMSISEVKAGEEFSILMPAYIDSSINLDSTFNFELKRHNPTTSAYAYNIPTNKKDQWFNISITFKAVKDVVFGTYPFYVYLAKNGLVRIKPPMLVRGNLIPSDYQPAFEDTESDINAVSSEIKQTADGMTLLATKTELNSAKSELQSGIGTATNKANNAQSTANNNAQTISTHTNQISALNTGLQAKVSQTDFNTLSGRVTTAENNITAKANELSSKITAVEVKIPTSVGGRNLLTKTNQGKKYWSWRISSGGTTAENYDVDGVNAVKLTRTSDASYTWHYIAYDGLIRKLIEPDTKYTLSFDVKPSVDVTFSAILQRGDGGAPLTNAVKMNKALANQWTKVSCVLTSKTTLPDDLSQVVYLEGMPAANGNWLIIKNIKLEKGVVLSDWSPAPEDTVNQISNLSSEIKQTADGMTLLATKTELNTAKNELQSGVNTATNKANAAQNTANSNAQTISTHTTQISALNTGLNAKVSQSDFNTLSGRVTTAENNITAKANELSSKITSVEGKIPTSSGGRNLAQGTSKDWSKPFTGFSGIQNTCPSLYKVLTDGLVVGDTFKTRIVLKYTNIVPASGKTAEIWIQGAGNVTEWKSGAYPSGGGGRRSISGSGEMVFELTDKINPDHLRNAYWNWAFRTDWIASGSLQWKLAKAERGMFFTDWSPAPEDTIEEISSLSSELKQTKDGITLLATKTELNTAKNELQSGINTATNKANSNAQTISTHTTQISALNTGLQAKVSQTDFNTLSGRVTNAENNITAKANELSSKITSVEGKIPTSVGGRNYIKDSEYRKTSIIVNDNQSQDEAFNISPAFWQNSNVYNKKIKLSFYYQASVAYGTERKFPVYFRESPWPWIGEVTYPANTTRPIKYTMAMTNALPANFTAPQIFIRFTGNLDKGRDHTITKVMLEVSDVFSDWQPAPEDTIEQISSLSSELKQTKDGITLLATKTELNTAKNELQSGINTATNKANSAQNTANSAQSTANSAQNKANSNAQTISTHTTQISALNTGLNAKVSQSDFNTLSGRVTTAENNITAKANELSSKITSVEGKIPSGETNLVEYGRPANGYSPYAGAEYTTHGFYYNGAFKMYIIRNKNTSEKTFGMNRFKVERNTEYTLYFKGFNNSAITNMDVWFLKRVNGSTKGWDSAQQLVTGRKLSNSRAEDISVTFNTGEYDEGYLRFDNNGTTTADTSADLYFGDVSVKKGRSNKGWSPSWSELATSQDLKNAQSEFKQTTDSIKASVSSLDKSTIKSSSLTINSDGIVMKAGKSTTDVANAIGSYFAVNQNAIDLFADKIKVKGNMIVSGSISSDKIASNGITANVIKGGTLQSTNGSTNFELNTGKLFYNNNNTGVFRVQNGASTMGLKFSNTSISVGGTNRILSRAILGGDRRESTLDDGKWDKGGFSGLVIETIKGVEPATNEHADALRAISDTIYFTHTYSADSPTGVSAHGWKMETYAPNSSYSGNIVLKPYGINYRQSDIVVGDVRLDNGDGSGYWMRATINTLKACFGHILNGGTSSQALNAIRSELNKISGI